jgi:anaerobic magnesium-protoporphyrin IX monomethyl ester cyclase
MRRKGFNRILLLMPGYRKSHYEYAGMPAGLGYVSESLLRSGFDSQVVVDMRLGYDYGHLAKVIRQFKPDIIGASLMSFRHKDHYALLERIKKDFPDVKIAAGGPHISTYREKALVECRAIDFGITLEGDDTAVELCQGREPLHIKGLIYNDEGQIKYTGDRPFITDLDNKAFAHYRFFETEKYPKFIPIVTSRGCPHSCIFCPVQLTIGKRLRVRTPESIIGEIDHWYAKGYRVFNIVDDNFTFYKKRVMDICAAIKSRNYSSISLSCRNGVRADTVDREMLVAMKDAGFNYLAFGVESASDRILESIKKGEKLADIENAVRNACELGYMVTLFFIMGFPHETEEDVKKSVDFAMKYPVFDVRFYNPIPFPGTELYDWVEKNNRFDKSVGDYLNSFSHWINRPVFSTPELSIERRKELYKEINKKIEAHTYKTKLLFSGKMEKMFKDMGIPGFLSGILARVYYMPVFQSLVVDTGLASRLKGMLNIIKKR